MTDAFERLLTPRMVEINKSIQSYLEEPDILFSDLRDLLKKARTDRIDLSNGNSLSKIDILEFNIDGKNVKWFVYSLNIDRDQTVHEKKDIVILMGAEFKSGILVLKETPFLRRIVGLAGGTSFATHTVTAQDKFFSGELGSLINLENSKFDTQPKNGTMGLDLEQFQIFGSPPGIDTRENANKLFARLMKVVFFNSSDTPHVGPIVMKFLLNFAATIGIANGKIASVSNPIEVNQIIKTIEENYIKNQENA